MCIRDSISGGYRYNYTQVVSDYVAVQDTNKGDLKEISSKTSLKPFWIYLDLSLIHI